MARIPTLTDTDTGTRTAPVGVTTISNGKPLPGVAVEITTINTVKRGKTGYDGTFTALIRQGDPVEIWIKKEGVNLGSGTGMWYNVAQVPGYARLGSTRINYTATERPPSAGAGAMTLGVSDIGGWFNSVISNPLGALISLPVFKEIAQAGATTAAVVESAGSQVAASAPARQIAQTVSGGKITTTPTPIKYTTVNVPKVITQTAPVPQAPSPPTFDLFKAISDANKAINAYNPFVASAAPQQGEGIITLPIAFKGAEQPITTAAPDSLRDAASNIAKTTGTDTALANAKAALDAQVKDVMDKGMRLIPPEIEVTAWDILMAGCLGKSQQCAQDLYNTKNAARIAAIKTWQASVQAAAQVSATPAQVLNIKTGQYFTPTPMPVESATAAIKDSLSKGLGSSTYYEGILAQATGMDPNEVNRITRIVANNISMMNAGQTPPGISGDDMAKIGKLGLLDIVGSGGTYQRQTNPSITTVGIPDLQPPVVIPASVAPSDWIVQRTADPDTIIGIDPQGNRYTKYRKGDWRLVQSTLITPEQVGLHVTIPATKNVVSGQEQFAVTNPVTGQMWTGEGPTIAFLAGGMLKNPVTLRDGTVVTTCDELAAKDPTQRQGAAWTECEASEAWRTRYLYTSSKGDVQQEAVAALLQKKLAGAATVVGDITTRVNAGQLPSAGELAQYRQNIADYQKRMAQITGVTGISLANPAAQASVPSVADLYAKYVSINSLKSVPLELTNRIGGSGVLP